MISCFVREFVHSFLRIRYTWLAAPFRKMADADTVEAVRKELQSVKSKAVGKIKALQAQVDTLQQQLSERPPAAPPDIASSDSSVQSDASGFVKIGSAESNATLKAREEEVKRREAELLEREELLLQREAEISRDVNSGSSWHAALILGLHEVQANVLQVHMACESAGSIR